ncbi:MAG: signal peptidase II [Victivallales bacterium]|nr:signal peptidase II [Victivallales bacterium]
MEKESDSKKEGIPFLWWPLCVTLVTFLLDQASKITIDMNCPEGWQCRVIPGLFNLVHWRNPGCAWGFLEHHTYLLSLISLAAFILVLVFFRKQNCGNRLLAFALALLEGGIAGNMVDRMFRNSVIDFLDFYIGQAHWPAFNIADSAICVSIGMILFYNFCLQKKDAGKEA